MIRFHLEDASALLDLSASVEWSHSLEDWQTALSAGSIFGHRESTQIQSSAAIYLYGRELASIGQVIVRAEVRRQGLARALVLHCLSLAPGRPTMLVATPAGQPLYERLGFRAIEPTFRFVKSEGSLSLPDPIGCREMTTADLPLAYASDAAAYGADRSRLLLERWKQVKHAAILIDGSGFAWGTSQNVGPVIAPGVEEAAQLISFLAARQTITVDVPERQSEFIRLLTHAGLNSIGMRPLMLLNASVLPGQRDCIFGLATLAYG